MELPAGTTGAPMSYVFEGKPVHRRRDRVEKTRRRARGSRCADAPIQQTSAREYPRRRRRRMLPQVTQEFVSVDAPVIALQHVRVIDGTGAAAVPDQTIVIEGSVIKAIGPAPSTQPPAGARVLDMTGKTALPGWVAMHEHLFYPGPTGMGRIPDVPEYYPTMVYTFPRMYLAGGRHDDANRRQHVAVRGSRNEALHRFGPHPGTQDASDRSVPAGPGRVSAAAAQPQQPGRSHQDGELLGRSRIHFVQGVHANHARAARDPPFAPRMREG